jgi:hypothetical protein
MPTWAIAAPSAAELQAQGEQLAKDGRFTEAIDAFKAADRLEPRASHACLIALAYTRRELWPQAEVFLSKCHALASASDPLPDWVPQAEQLIKDRFANVNVAPVEIEVQPAEAQAKLTVSSFAPDELFEARTIHLPPGHHVIAAIAEGYQGAQQSVDITDKTPQHVVIKLTKMGIKRVGGPGSGHAAPSSTPKYLIVGGGGALALGVLVHATLYRSYRNDLAADAAIPDAAAYHDHESAYDISRWSVIGLYAVGGAALVVGAYLKLTSHDDEAPAVAAFPISGGGGMVSVEWHR